ncbi:MAG: zinc dependent phospholipase C family protein [Deltaproteobacteria bacterium]|nr:zinc dependent phospholipase C family protein [Deltaproteobacteria bacterium]
MLISSILASALILVLMPHDAFAWGPATHLEYAHRALASLALFPPLVRKLLVKYEDDYLYGSVAADITVGKGFTEYLYNCHNWRVAFELFHKKAVKDHEKAFMLGYLVHLAADTVAHNFFVPFKLIRSWSARFLKHIYWEMRMDLTVPAKYWDMTHHFSKNNFVEDDRLLQGHLKRTLFSFNTNKKIFNGLLIAQRLKHWRIVVQNMGRRSAWRLIDSDVVHYKNLALKAAVDLLTRIEDSYVLKADPTGKLKILYARDMVKKIRRTDKTGELGREGKDRLLNDIKKRLEAGIYEPVTLPIMENYLKH